MDRLEKPDNSSLELLRNVLKGVLVLEQSKSKQTFSNLKKGLKKAEAQKLIPRGMQELVRKETASLLKAKENSMAKNTTSLSSIGNRIMNMLKSDGLPSVSDCYSENSDEHTTFVGKYDDYFNFIIEAHEHWIGGVVTCCECGDNEASATLSVIDVLKIYLMNDNCEIIDISNTSVEFEKLSEEIEQLHRKENPIENEKCVDCFSDDESVKAMSVTLTIEEIQYRIEYSVSKNGELQFHAMHQLVDVQDLSIISKLEHIMTETIMQKTKQKSSQKMSELKEMFGDC